MGTQSHERRGWREAEHGGELQLGSTSRWVRGGVPCSLVLDDGYLWRSYSSSQGVGVEASGNSGGAPRTMGGAREATNWSGDGGPRVSKAVMGKSVCEGVGEVLYRA
jgi:hypothetical protein